MDVIVKAPGSCGELVQGTIDENPFLVTCPINLFSSVKIIRGNISSEYLIKAEQAVRKTQQYLALEAIPLSIQITTQLPRGKGMASSSADISAACLATAKFFGKDLLPEEILRIALSIEPTDGIFFPGIVMLDHIRGTGCVQLGVPPAMKVAIFDCGGEIDTVYFNRRQDLCALNRKKEPIVKQALQFVKTGIEKKDCKLIGQGATLSALANQTILPKPYLPQIIQLAEQYHAVGVNVAHSGTVLGVLFDPLLISEHDECIDRMQTQFPLQYITTAQLIEGGLIIEGGLML